MTTAQSPLPGGIPILGPLGRASRIALVVTLVVAVVAIALDYVFHVDETLLFIISAAAILGLAWVVGLSTERLGAISGPQVGGILNATFGNIAELIIAFFALQAGLIEVVKASITGSIIGNLLLVLGASVLIGGLKNGTQRFSQSRRRLGGYGDFRREIQFDAGTVAFGGQQSALRVKERGCRR